MFTIIAWIIIGLIAGAIARLILPGRQGSGWLGALITGLLGAVLGGWLSTLLGGEGLGDAFSWQTLIWSVIGGVIVAFIWQAITSRRGTRV